MSLYSGPIFPCTHSSPQHAHSRSRFLSKYSPSFNLVTYAHHFVSQEAAIQRDAAMREEYRAYMRKVPAKVIPYVW